MKNADLNLMVVFDAVMSERNLRKAGERLNRSQPAISQAIARLRDITGDRLFERTATGIAPTARAELLWAETRDPLAQLRRVLAPSEFQPADLVGETVLGLSDDVRILFWPRLARAITDQAPRATLRALDTNHGRVWRDLGEGLIDVALTVAGQPPPGFGARILHQDRFCLLVRRGSAPPRTVQDYAARRHLALVFSDEQPAYADEALGAEGLHRHVIARVSRFDTLPDLVVALDAVVALPRLIASRFAQRPDLTLSDPPVPFPSAILKLCWHEKTRNDPMARWLRTLAIDTVTSQIDGMRPNPAPG